MNETNVFYGCKPIQKCNTIYPECTKNKDKNFENIYFSRGNALKITHIVYN
jgi:hypothetical protein